jgi:hypothetical protein
MRKINGAFHIEGEQIIKTSNGEAIPEDEPLFLLRGRDRLAATLLSVYWDLAEEDGCNQWFLDKVKEAMDKFQNFAIEHHDRMKQPGITMGK